MKLKNIKALLLAVLFISFSSETFAGEWNVSLWGKPRAFTEHVEKIAELVSQKRTVNLP